MIQLNEKYNEVNRYELKSIRVSASQQSNLQVQAHMEHCCFVTIGIIEFL